MVNADRNASISVSCNAAHAQHIVVNRDISITTFLSERIIDKLTTEKLRAEEFRAWKPPKPHRNEIELLWEYE